jgi:hypothetical protein
MKKMLGKVTQINMYILLLSIFFFCYDLLFIKLNLIATKTISLFYAREIVALILAAITIRLFFNIENRYEEE